MKAGNQTADMTIAKQLQVQADRIEELEATIERVRQLPLQLTDDEESCTALREYIESALMGKDNE